MEWQPIETAPRDGTRVLIVNDDGAMAVAGYVEEWHERSEFVRKARDGDVFRTVREDVGYWDTDIAYCPTHWMLLPDKPSN
jgi:hypothetical protein